MRGYTAFLSAQMRTLLQYRAAALAGMATQLFFGLVMVMAYGAFYRSTTAPQPMNYEQVVTYVWLGQALLGLLPWNVDPDIRQFIRSGDVAYELLRPFDLYNLWYTRALARRIAPTLLRAVPFFLIAGLFLGLQPPPNWACGLAWAAATVAALLLSCAITTLLGISLLWTISGEGAFYLLVSAVILLSGMNVPLPFFPDWAKPVLDFLPFRGLVDTPFRLYLGHIPPARAPGAIGHQLVWTLALIALGRWLLSRGLRRLVVQGG